MQIGANPERGHMTVSHKFSLRSKIFPFVPFSLAFPFLCLLLSFFEHLFSYFNFLQCSGAVSGAAVLHFYPQKPQFTTLKLCLSINNISVQSLEHVQDLYNPMDCSTRHPCPYFFPGTFSQSSSISGSAIQPSLSSMRLLLLTSILLASRVFQISQFLSGNKLLSFHLQDHTSQ